MRLGVGAGAGTVLALGAVLAASWALAPDRAAVTSTSPADRMVLARAPTEVELAFTGPVDLALSHVLVRDRTGTAVNAGPPSLVTPERLRQPVHITTAGEVDVSYHVIFVDGADLAGMLRFTVDSDLRRETGMTAGAGAGSASATETVVDPVHEHEIDPISAVLLVLDGIVALAVIVLLMRRPRPRAA